MIRAAGVMVWEIFFLAYIGNFIPIIDNLNAVVYLGIVADHMSQFMTTVYQSSGDYFQ